jgi:hypothetical protein
MIDELGWLEGDTLDMEVNEETGTITLINISCNERKANVTG